MMPAQNAFYTRMDENHKRGCPSFPFQTISPLFTGGLDRGYGFTRNDIGQDDLIQIIDIKP